MSAAVLDRMIAEMIETLAEIGYCVETGLNLECCRFDPIEPPAGITPERRMNNLVLQRSGDTEHHNYLFVVGGPSMYAPHQTFSNRWVIMAALAHDLRSVGLSPEKSPDHRRAVMALELAR